jgi:ACS family tartrate transporter-like MFS transporter
MNDRAASPALQAFNEEALSRRVLRMVAWRLVPFLCLLYMCNIIDRANAGFARLTMESDLGISPRVFNIGFGLFYFGYLLFEVPSNLLLRRVGARKWIARIMVSWGVVSCFTLAVTGPWSFYLARILLGVAEAGFFPGIVYYLCYWFPARERARVIALFMAAIPFAGIISNPVSGAIMQSMNNVGGMHGWQWLFLLEGIPSVIFGFFVLLWLTDCPKEANWLPAEERDWLVERMKQEERYRHQRHGSDLLNAATDWRVWLLICAYFPVAMGANASGAHVPKLIKEHFTGYNPLQIGLLSALPHVAAALGMTLLGTHSDRTGERRKHLAFAAFLAAGGWLLSWWAPSPWLALAGFCLAQMGMLSMLPVFWTLPTSFLSGAAAAGGIALINSVANVGGLIGPFVLGELGLMSMAAILFAGGILALVVCHDPTLDRGLPAPVLLENKPLPRDLGIKVVPDQFSSTLASPQKPHPLEE